jgi:FixJ family two-component response regulator
MPQAIAIVDDEPSVLRALKRLVEASGLATQIYGSGEEFLNACSEQIACVVLDINMGGMSGIQTRQYMSARQMDIPVIFITAMDTAVVRQEARSAGCSAYLRKPFSGNVLIEAIRTAVPQLCAH